MEFKVGDFVRLIDDSDNYFKVIDVDKELGLVFKKRWSSGSCIYYSFHEVEKLPDFTKAKEKAINGLLETVHEEASTSKGGALRYNKGKPQFSHLSPDFILEMMKGMTKANEKYAYLNYTKAQDVRTAADSLMRHFLKFQQGQDVDAELNTHHLALVAINAMIMYQNLLDFGDEVDNRYSKEKNKVQG